MTDAEIAAFLSGAPQPSQNPSEPSWQEPARAPSSRLGTNTSYDKTKSEIEEVSPLSILERILTSFGNPNTDQKGFKKFLEERGYKTKRFAGDTYVQKGNTSKFGNVDPLPNTVSEFGKDALADVGDYFTSVPASLGAAAGGIATAATGGYAAPLIPVLSAAGGYGGQKLKEFIGKNIGVVSPDAPSEASSQAMSEGLAALLPMITSLLKTGVVKSSKGLMKNMIPAAYGNEIGIRDFAKKDPVKAKQLVQLLLDQGVYGKRATLDKISEKAVPAITSEIDDVLSKSNKKIGWQDIGGKLFNNLEDKGSVLEPVSEKQAVIDWITKLKSKGTDINKGLFPVGTKKSLVESEKIKRKLNDFVKNFYKQGVNGKITSEEADLAGQTQSIIRDLVREGSGDPEKIKALNQKLLAYSTLGKGVEGLEGDDFLKAIGSRASSNALPALAGASGGIDDIAKYKWWKMLLNSLPTELPTTAGAVGINKISKAKPFTSAKTDAILQFLSSVGAKNLF